MSDQNYYWLIKYAKQLNIFFASDIKKALDKDDIYFHIGTIVGAIEHWKERGCIKILDQKYVSTYGGQSLRKYIWVKDPE